MIQQVVRDFLMLLVTIDPIGTLALFVPITSGYPPEEKKGSPGALFLTPEWS